MVGGDRRFERETGKVDGLGNWEERYVWSL